MRRRPVTSTALSAGPASAISASEVCHSATRSDARLVISMTRKICCSCSRAVGMPSTGSPPGGSVIATSDNSNALPPVVARRLVIASSTSDTISRTSFCR
jgi:hypothetical protein